MPPGTPNAQLLGDPHPQPSLRKCRLAKSTRGRGSTEDYTTTSEALRRSEGPMAGRGLTFHSPPGCPGCPSHSRLLGDPETGSDRGPLA